MAERATIEIDHPPGGRTVAGGGPHVHLLVGALSFSSKTRAVLCESEDQAHLIDGIWRASQRLGGVTRRWRFDRMSTVVYVGSDRLLPSFAAVAKHYGVLAGAPAAPTGDCE